MPAPDRSFRVPLPAHLSALSPYQAGKPADELARELGMHEANIVKLASNENPLGMSPLAEEAARRAAGGEASRYPDADGYVLKKAIAAKLGVRADRILLGNGSNDVLDLVARAVLAPGTAAVYDAHSFFIFRQVAAYAGAVGRSVPSDGFAHNLEAMADAAASPDVRIVFIANPNNPTGTFHREPALRKFLESVPRSVLVVLDEAYGDYLDDADRIDSVLLVRDHPNLILVRTLSKAYGLAGLRIGFGLADPELIGHLDKVRQPFAASVPAQAAAVAALGDTEFLERTREHNRIGRRQLADGLHALHVECLSSYGNFVLCRPPRADRVHLALLRMGVIVRPLAPYGLSEWLRVSVGLTEENARFLEAICVAVGEVATFGQLGPPSDF